MHAKQSFNKTMEIKIQEVRVKLLELQTRAKQGNPDLCSKNIKDLKIIERQIEGATNWLRHLASVEGHLGEQLKDNTKVVNRAFTVAH